MIATTVGCGEAMCVCRRGREASLEQASHWLRPCIALACFGVAFGTAEPGRSAEPREPGAGLVAAPGAPSKPFFELRSRQTEYVGPGREAPPPVKIDEILIGYFGPYDANDPEGGDAWLAAQWAVAEANSRGGFEGKLFRLVPGWSDNPWGSGVVQVTRMVYTDRVWAIVGGIDGPTTHLAEQVVAKARVALVSPGSTDKSVNLANVPWMFSLLPGDHLLARPLAAEISARMGRRRVVLVSADDHDSHLFAGELKKQLAGHHAMPEDQFVFAKGSGELRELADRVMGGRPAGIIVVADAYDSGRLVAALRGGGFAGMVFGGPTMGRRRFAAEAGASAEGAVFPLLYAADEESAFVEGFQKRFGRQPDYLSAHTYDAMRLLFDAMRRAGLNRARIRDAMAELSPWQGIGGSVQWDKLGSNYRAVRLGTICKGQAVALGRP